MNKIKLRLELIKRATNAYRFIRLYTIFPDYKDLHYFTDRMDSGKTFIKYFFKYLTLYHTNIVKHLDKKEDLVFHVKLLKEFKEKLIYTSCDGIL